MLIFISMCLVLDTVAFDGKFLAASVQVVKTESHGISTSFNRWFSQTFF